MPKWSPKKNEFTVKIAYDKHGRAKATIPAPIIKGLDRPQTLTFVLGSSEITAVFEHKKTEPYRVA